MVNKEVTVVMEKVFLILFTIILLQIQQQELLQAPLDGKIPLKV